MRPLHHIAVSALMAALILSGGCKPRPHKPEAASGGEPVKASPTEQISLYLSISPRDLMMGRMPAGEADTQISGGWGFSREEACIVRSPKSPEQGINKEFLNWVQALIDARNILEFTQTLPSGERLYVIDSANYVQENIREGERVYLRVLYSVFTVNEPQFREMSYWVKDPGVSEEMFSSRVRAVAREQERVFWFDITEPHTHNARVRGGA